MNATFWRTATVKMNKVCLNPNTLLFTFRLNHWSIVLLLVCTLKGDQQIRYHLVSPAAAPPPQSSWWRQMTAPVRAAPVMIYTHPAAASSLLSPHLLCHLHLYDPQAPQSRVLFVGHRLSGGPKLLFPQEPVWAAVGRWLPVSPRCC